MYESQYNITRAAYSVAELLELLPLGRTSLYAAIQKGDLKASKYGKRTMFLAPDIVDFLCVLRNAGGMK